jgi:bacterioferritin-associated ferredoxin
MLIHGGNYMAVTRCICRSVSFREVIRLAGCGFSFDQIKSTTGCGTGCGACSLYARLAAITGVCDLPVMRPEQLMARIERAEAARGATPAT